MPGYIGMPQTLIVGSQGDFADEEGIPHAVVDPITAQNLDMDEFYHSEKNIKIIRTSIDVIEIPDIYGNRKDTKVEWIELQIDMKAHFSVEKYFCPSESQICMTSVCYQSSADVDILVILGEPTYKESEYYVLASMFLKNHSLSDFDHNSNSELFEHLMSLLPKRGYETTRTGGALGLCLKNEDTRKFIYKKGTFPRHRSTCRSILVNCASMCGVMCYYCRKHTKEYTGWFYHTPRVGGHTMISWNTAVEYPIFQLFQNADCKQHSS